MSDHEILSGLASGEVDQAWERFLELYTGLICQVAHHFDDDEERLADCYVFVCEKLSDDGFRRLLQYKTDGRASFRTWLAAVVRNLCIDWRRQRFGRKRPLRVLADLNEFEQAVFGMLHEAGATRRECLRSLRYKYPDITESHIIEVSSRIHRLLSPKQRFYLLARRRETVSLSGRDGNPSLTREPVAPGPSVEDCAALAGDQQQLQAAMAKLQSEERLVLQLRFQRDLSLREIADLMALRDPSVVHRQIERAIAKLAEYLEA